MTAVESSGDRWNFRALLGQGALGNVGQQLASAGMVLPFLFAAVGGPIFIAGLLVPVYRGTGLISQILAVPIISQRSCTNGTSLPPSLLWRWLSGFSA